MGRVEFTPTISGPFLRESPSLWESYSKKLNWWTRESVIYHPYVLLSYYYAKHNPYIEGVLGREYFRIPSDTVVVGDSGGYTVYTKGISLNPVDVARWQSENVDVAIGLDIPYEKSTEHVPLSTVEKHAEKSYKNYVEQYNELLKADRRVKFYPVLHGRNIREIRTWYGIAIKPLLKDLDLKIDGIAMSFPPSRPEIAVLQTNFVLMEVPDLKYAHWFQGSSWNMLPAFAYKSDFELLTFDAQGFNESSKYATVYMTPLLDKLKLGRKSDITPKCFCPVCQYAVNNLGKTYDYLRNPKSALDYLLLQLHNLALTIWFYEIAKVDVKVLLKYASNNVRQAYNMAENKYIPLYKWW